VTNQRDFVLAMGLALSLGFCGSGQAEEQTTDGNHKPSDRKPQQIALSSMSKSTKDPIRADRNTNSVAPNSEIPTTPLKATVPAKKTRALESVEVDTRMPVIPLVAAKPMEMDDLNLDEAKDALRQLIRAQEKMMTQMQMLQARIEKNEQVSQASQQAVQAASEKIGDNTSLLQSVSRRVVLQGYVESGYRAYSHAPRDEEYLGANGKSGSDFSARRVVLRPRLNFTDKASWYGELEVEDIKNEVSMEESVFNYNYRPWMNLKTGIMTVPYTTTAMNHDAPLRLLVDRPLVDQYIIPTTYSDLGAGFTGLVPVGRRGALNYEFDVVNGFTDTFAPADPGRKVSSNIEYQGLRDLRPGEHIYSEQGRDNNRNKQVFGRIGYSPLPGLQMAVSGSTGFLDSNNKVGMTLLASEIMYRIKKWSFLGEYAMAMLNNKASGLSSQGVPYKLFPGSMGGFFAQAAYDFTPKWTGISAYNYINVDRGSSGNVMQRVSLGMRYNPFSNVYLKTEYQFGTPRAQFSGQEHYSNALLTQLTFQLL